MTYRNVTPGIRFFECDDCGTTWESPSRDCQSPSGECCPQHDCLNNMHSVLHQPYQYEPHPEWPKDQFGNPIDKRIRY